MRKHQWLTCAVMGLVLTVLTPSALAQTNGGDEPDPAAIAQQCIQQTAMTAGHRVQANLNAASSCVAAIEVFLAQGDVFLAHLLASQCSAAIWHSSNATVIFIAHRCQNCIQVLLFLDAPGYAQAVAQACQNGVQAVLMSRNAAINAIQNAFGDG